MINEALEFKGDWNDATLVSIPIIDKQHSLSLSHFLSYIKAKE